LVAAVFSAFFAQRFSPQCFNSPLSLFSIIRIMEAD
jgi:hypothetical protein